MADKNEYRLIMLEKHDANNKYALAELKKNEIPNNNNVLKDSNCEPNDEPKFLEGRRTFQNALPQILATCAKNLLLLTYGMTLGITTIAIPALEGDPNLLSNLTTEEHRLRTDILTLTQPEISWFSSINLICVPLGCFISGAITQPLGRKKSMMLLNIPFFTVWLLYYNATSVTTLYIALIISGLAGGLHEAPVLTYLAEITEPYLRGMLGATAPTTVIIGTVSQLVLGNFYHWRSVVLFNMFFPILAFIALSFVPESPHWLISRGRFDDAEKSLCWLRGWVHPNQVQQEFSMLKKFILRKHRTKASLRELIKSYRLRTFIIPYLIVIGTFFVGQFGGMMSVQTNAVKLFTLLGTPVNEYTATLILGLVEFAGAVFCVVLVHWTGKRKLMIGTTFGCGLCLFTLAIFDYYHSYTPAAFISNFTWVPIVFLNVFAFFIHAGIRLLPWVLIGEVYPTHIRAIASGASALWFYIFAFMANKSFRWMLDELHLYGLFTLYGTVISLGSIFFFVFLPETEGFTLPDIERHFGKKGNIFKTKMHHQDEEDYEVDSPQCAKNNSKDVESSL